MPSFAASRPLHLEDPPDGPGIFGLPYGPGESLFHVIPAPFEATTSYGRGTARGPAAILEASEQIDLLDLDFGRPWVAGIHMLPPPPGLEALNEEACRLVREEGPGSEPGETEVDRLCRRANAALRHAVSHALRQGRIVGVLGGDHSMALPAIQAHAEAFTSFGVLQIDAHMDLRKAYQGFHFSHASVMRNVLESVPAVTKLVQVAVRDFCEEEQAFARAATSRVAVFPDTLVRDANHGRREFTALARQIVDELPRHVYVSFDIDGLDPRLCPSTGTPVPGGLSFHQASELLRCLAASGRRIIGFDLCEVAPGKDGPWDANVGARVLYKLIGATLLSRLDARRSPSLSESARRPETQTSTRRRVRAVGKRSTSPDRG